jgi:hypothetical protein
VPWRKSTDTDCCNQRGTEHFTGYPCANLKQFVPTFHTNIFVHSKSKAVCSNVSYKQFCAQQTQICSACPRTLLVAQHSPKWTLTHCKRSWLNHQMTNSNLHPLLPGQVKGPDIEMSGKSVSPLVLNYETGAGKTQIAMPLCSVCPLGPLGSFYSLCAFFRR